MSAATQDEMERLRKERDEHEQARTALEEDLGQVILERDEAFARGKQVFEELRRVEALAAHVDRMAQALKYHRVIHDMDEMPEELQRAHEEMETAILASPAASLARIKAEAAAEALEEEANEWPADKYTECSHVRESILGSAAQLRQQAEAGES